MATMMTILLCMLLVKEAKKNVLILKFLILSPHEVPAIGECVHIIVVSKLNELSRK